ncbi:MAG: phenylacetate--CoA ligase family protein [Planctomycetia bacterium]|nr:phenylacetate--CoA ligase family protein [Planctomycetia bacterium]
MWSTLPLLWKSLQQRAVLWNSPQRIRAIQERRLRALVARARKHSPYYAERLRHIDPRRFALRDLPTVTKADMMRHFDRFVTDRRLKLADLERFIQDPARLGQWYLGRYAVSHTSGTQGQKAVIVQDRSMTELLFALQMLRGSVLTVSPLEFLQRLFQRNRLAAVTIGQGFYPSAVALAYAPPAADVLVQRLWIKRIEPLSEVVEKLNRFQPHVLLAYANVLEMLSHEEQADRLRLARPGALRQIMNMSEPLPTGAQEAIRKAFGIALTDNYGMGECLALSAGCPQGHGMHLNADWAILEVVDRQHHPVPPGQPGEKVLLTNLYNAVQPFIRYEVTDVVTMSPAPCPCGSPLPLIASVAGRTDEVVWIQDGEQYRQVHPYVFVDILDRVPEVGLYQVRQVERNRFVVQAAPAPGRTLLREPLERALARGLEEFELTELLDLEVVVNADLAPDPKSGKLKRIVSDVARPDMDEARLAAR